VALRKPRHDGRAVGHDERREGLEFGRAELGRALAGPALSREEWLVHRLRFGHRPQSRRRHVVARSELLRSNHDRARGRRHDDVGGEFGSLGPWNPDGFNPYVTSRESDGLTWTPAPFTTPAGFKFTQGGPLGYDPVHHLLYCSNGTQGFWRVVTQ